MSQHPETDVIIVGAGFAGMYTAIHAQKRGLRVHGIEAASGVGGTWHWNRYPGARCDVESIDYSYSFDRELEREWRWSERYATQPEILRYMNFVADRYDVRPLYDFDTRVTAAVWDEPGQMWTVETDTGKRYTSRWLVMASGSLSAPILPNITGLDSFTGEIYQTAAWPLEEPDLAGKRIAVIGTGSSGIQAVPLLAQRASELTVFQRTPNYSVPAYNRELSDEEWAEQLAGLEVRRAKSWNGPAGSPWGSTSESYDNLSADEREGVLEESWTRGGVLFSKAFATQLTDPVVNDAAREFFERKIAAKVQDPSVRETLIPKGQYLGTKRICTDTGYYETFNEPHVKLINLRDTPIDRITESGIVVGDDTIEVDVIVCATGFDAMTGALTQIDIFGRDGVLLRDEWSEGHTTLLGIGVPGFPNLLALNGPGSPSVFANMALTSEQQGDFALNLIEYAAEHGFTSVDTRADAALAWVEHVEELAAGTLFGGSKSWYTGANLDGKPTRFLPYPGGFKTYNDRAQEIADNGYEGFVFSEVLAAAAV